MRLIQRRLTPTPNSMHTPIKSRIALGLKPYVSNNNHRRTNADLLWFIVIFLVGLTLTVLALLPNH